MTTFQQLTSLQLDEAAEYIAALNSKKNFHIGYCGTNKADILQDLHEDFVTDNVVNIFVARSENQITGLVGFDIYDGIAEVWGPFSSEQHEGNQLKLWQFATARIEQLQKYLFFINEENTFQQQFMQLIQAQKSSDELYLKVTKDAFHSVTALQSTVFDDQYFMQFDTIHSQAFPNAYYNAKTIVEKLLNQNNQLIILTENHSLKGYVYFEMNETLHSTHLEFITIAPNYRGQGLGEQLLNEALTRIFDNKAITQVTLTVNNLNNKANNLYYKTGFQKQDALLSYVLSV